MKASYNRTLLSALAIVGTVSIGVSQTSQSGIVGGSSSASSAYQGIGGSRGASLLDTTGAPQIMADGSPMSFSDASPGLYQGQLIVPVRAVAEQLGASVTWQSDTKTVVLTTPKQTLQFSAVPYAQVFGGSNDVRAQQMAGSQSSTGAAAWGSNQVVIINNRSYMPFEQLTAAMNATGNWNQSGGTATITLNNGTTDTTDTAGTSGATGTTGTIGSGAGTSDSGAGTLNGGSNGDMNNGGTGNDLGTGKSGTTGGDVGTGTSGSSGTTGGDMGTDEGNSGTRSTGNGAGSTSGTSGTTSGGTGTDSGNSGSTSGGIGSDTGAGSGTMSGTGGY